MNLPPVPAATPRASRWTTTRQPLLQRVADADEGSLGPEIFWIGGGSITWTGGVTSDHAAIHEGYISVTPLQMDLTNYGLLETVRGWSLEG